EPVPFVRRIVGDRVGLPDAVGVAPLRDYEVVELHAAGVADRERKGLHRAADRAPHLDDRKTPAQQIVGLVGKEIAHALWTRPFCCVVAAGAAALAILAACAPLGGGGPRGGADHAPAVRPALALPRFSHLGVVDPPHLGLVV